MTSHANYTLYDALTEAGLLPASAIKIERFFDGAMETRQDELRAELRDQTVTKADLKNEILLLRTELAQVEARLLKAGSDQLRWMIGTLLAVSGLTVTLIKLL